MCFKSDAVRSIRAFDKFSRHALNRHFGGNALIRSFEGSDNPAEQNLDMNHGIDGVVVTADGWTHNFASRCSFVQGFNTFTVRGYRPTGTPTEFDKIGRVEEEKPEFTAQCYVDSDGRGAVVGIAETVEIYQYIDRHKPAMRFNHRDGVGFYAVPFSELATAKIYYVDACGNVTDVTAKIKASAA